MIRRMDCLRCIEALVLCSGLLLGGPAVADGWEFLATEIPGSRLSSSRDGFVVASLVTSHPREGLLVYSPDSDSATGSALMWLRDPESATSAVEPFGPHASRPILQLAADGDSVVLLDPLAESIAILGPDGVQKFEFSARAFFAIQGLAILGDRVVGLGEPLLSKQAISARNLKDIEWRRAHARPDCRLFMTDLGRDHLAVDALFCAPGLELAAEPFWGGGQLLPDRRGDRVYAVLARHPALLIFDRQGKKIAETTYLESGEAWAPPAPVLPQGGGQQDWRATLGNLTDTDYPTSLIEGPEVVGVVFRRSREGLVELVADIFDRDGHKLDNDVVLPLGRLAADVLVRSFRLVDGRQYLLLQSLSSFSEIASQRLFRIEWVSRLAATETLRLQVTDRAGEPVSEASVVDLATEESWSAAVDGKVEIAAPAGSLSLISIAAPGYLPRQIELGRPFAELTRVVLQRGDGVRFAAHRLDDLSPVTELQVEIRRGGGMRFLDLNETSGRYVVPDLKAGSTTLVLRAAGLLSQQLDLSLGGEVEDLGMLLMDPGASIEGTLLAPSGMPTVGARLSHTPSHPLGRAAASRLLGDYVVETDSLGRFQMGGFNAGSVCLRLQPLGGTPAALEIEALRAGELRLLAPTVLGSGAELAGQVIDRAEVPQAGVEVELRSGPIHNPCLRYTTQADRAGAFSFSAVAAGAYHLVALENGQLLASRRLEVVDGDRLDELVLETARTAVEGLVTLDGLPASGGQVMIEPAGAELPLPVFMTLSGQGEPLQQELLSDLPSFLAMEVGTAGEFSGAGVLPAGSAEVVYRSLEGASYRQALTVSGDGFLKVDLSFGGLAATGSIVDPDGLPVGASALEVRHGDQVIRQVAGDSRGRFVIPHLPPGTYLLAARAGTLAGEARLSWTGEVSDPVQVVLWPGQMAELRLEVRDRDDQALAGVLLAVRGPAGTRRVVTTDAEGRALVTGLRPGHYDSLLVFGGRRLAAGPTVTLLAGTLTERVFEEPPWTEVVLDAGNRIPGPIRLTAPDGQQTATILSLAGIDLWPNAEGKIVLPALSEGRWQVGDEGQGFRSIVVRGSSKTFDLH